MYIIKTYFIAILIVLFAGTFSPTISYFSDTENSMFNMFMATLLDGEIDGDGFQADICQIGEDIETDFSFKNIGAIPFTYSIDIPIIADDSQELCSLMSLTASKNGEVFYVGLIESFAAESLPLSVGESDQWQFKVEFVDGVPDFAVDGKQCNFDTVFTATQLGFVDTEAFSDIEILAHSIEGLGANGGGGGDVIIITDNDAVVINNATTTTNTGGNTSTGGASSSTGGNSTGGDGGSITTGSASSTTTIINNVNETNVTVTTSCGTCGSTTVTTCTSGCSGGTHSRSTLVDDMLKKAKAPIDDLGGHVESTESVVEEVVLDAPAEQSLEE